MKILFAVGDNLRTRSGVVSAQNMFSPWVRIDNTRAGADAAFTAALVDDSTTLSCTWVIQARRVLTDTTYGVIADIFTSSALSNGGYQTGSMRGVWEFRVGVKTGGYTAGAGVASINW